MLEWFLGSSTVQHSGRALGSRLQVMGEFVRQRSHAQKMTSKSFFRSFLVVLVATTTPAILSAQVIDSVDTAMDSALRFDGCYEMAFRDWNNDEAAEASRSIPHRLWLTAVSFPPDTGQAYIKFVMRPAPNHRQSAFQAESWSLMPNADSLVLTWDNFFHGLQAVIGMEDEGRDAKWRGRSFYWTDEIEVVIAGQPARPEARGIVLAQEVACR